MGVKLYGAGDCSKLLRITEVNHDLTLTIDDLVVITRYDKELSSSSSLSVSVSSPEFITTSESESSSD